MTHPKTLLGTIAIFIFLYGLVPAAIVGGALLATRLRVCDVAPFLGVCP